MNRQLLLGGAIALTVLIAALMPVAEPVRAFHSPKELATLRQMMEGPIDSSIIFPTASTCQGCHGFDSNYYAMVDFFGNDVNVHDDWQSSMMANSAKDPFWRAKVSHELLSVPASFSEEIQTKCTSCHAPMGHYTALYRGHDHYTIEDLLQDTIGLDGVSCAACHKIAEDQIGQLHSGNINFDTNRVIYGPYPLPFAGPMEEFIGFDPVHSDHISDAGLCASCHTLVTSPIGSNGQLTGTTFVEQATYHEWLNSAYETDNVSCQSCHLPQLEESIVISSNYAFLEGRSPYGLHEMVGGNTFMLELMKTYREELDIPALPEHFDETISATYAMLQEQSLDMTMDWLGVEGDTAYLGLQLVNKAGHKFPSGYPSRRLFLDVLVETSAGDTLFHSGAQNVDYSLVGETAGVEPHYDIINTPDQVQIYEMAAGDDNGQFTVLLERAAVMLKDNRLPPLGFTTSDAVYDTTRIVGRALQDEDFNYQDGAEGSGSDYIRYHIATGGYAGPVRIHARAYYHSLPPRWVNPIFDTDSPEINAFHGMFSSIENAPVLVEDIRVDTINFPVINGSNAPVASPFSYYPNPSPDGHIRIRDAAGIPLKALRVYDVQGQIIATYTGQWPESIQLPRSGVYWLVATASSGEQWIDKVVVF